MVLFAYNNYSHYNLDICIYSLTAIEICLHEQEGKGGVIGPTELIGHAQAQRFQINASN